MNKSLSNERKVGKKHYKNGHDYSPALAMAARKVINLKNDIRREYTRTNPDKNLIKAMKRQFLEANKDFRKAQGDAPTLRKKHLTELAEKKSLMWNQKEENVIKVIQEAEKSKKLHKKQRYYLKPRQEGTINHLYVPKPLSYWQPKRGDIKNKKSQMRVDNPKEIFNLLLRQNFTHL